MGKKALIVVNLKGNTRAKEFMEVVKNKRSCVKGFSVIKECDN